MPDHREQLKPNTPRNSHVTTASAGQEIVETQVSIQPQQCEETEDEFDFDESYEEMLANLPHDAFTLPTVLLGRSGGRLYHCFHTTV